VGLVDVAVALLLGSGKPAGGGDDVVVELGPEHRHEDVAVFDVGRLLGQRPLGDLDAPGERGPLEDLAVDDIEEEAEQHPATADPAGPVMEGENAEEGESAEQGGEKGRQGKPGPAPGNAPGNAEWT